MAFKKPEIISSQTMIKPDGKFLEAVKDIDTELLDSDEKPIIISEEEFKIKEPPKAKEENAISFTDKHSEKYVDKILDDKLNSIDTKRNVYGVGKVVNVKDFILEVVGFEDVAFYEKVNIGNKGIGYVIQLKPNRAVVAILEKYENIQIGDEVYQTNEIFMGDYSDDSIGRIIDLFGNDKLSNKKFSNTKKIAIEMDTHQT